MASLEKEIKFLQKLNVQLSDDAKKPGNRIDVKQIPEKHVTEIDLLNNEEEVKVSVTQETDIEIVESQNDH